MSKVGRNDPCYCGSGKKYKKCCLLKDEEKNLEELKGDAIVEEGEKWEEENETRRMTIDDKPEGIEEDEAEFEENEEGGYEAKDENDIRYNTGNGKDIFSVRDGPYPAISKEEERIVDEW
jgi:hypothetical protein